ncbi:MAG: hypothetical protein ACRD2S_08095 [Terriglobales bacterium]
MNRRQFVSKTLWGLGALAAQRRLSASEQIGGKHPSSSIQYIRKNPPAFEIPSYRGQVYSDNVPDTLDIAEHAKLGVHALTSITDPAFDYEIYWSCNFFRNPPVMKHDFNDWVQNQEGLMEALPLLRNATGDDSNAEVDRGWMESTLKSIGPDGLMYVPLEGRPWGRLNADGINPVWKADGTKSSFSDRSVTQAANASTCQRMMGTMTLYYLRDQNPMWKTTIDKMIRRLDDLTIKHEDYAFFAPGSFEPQAKVGSGALMPLGSTWGVSWNTRLVQGLMQYYRVSKHEPARELAQKLVAYTRYHGEIFYPDGRWYLDPEIRGEFQSAAVPNSIRKKYPVQGVDFGGHGHGHGIAVLSLIDYADAVGDKDSMQFARNSFEWARSPGAEYGVSTLMGWFPEFYVPEYPSCEGCIVGDMLSMAVKLSSLGVGDYWDDVDRWVRNQFFEQQLTSVDWVYRLAAREPAKPVGPFELADRAPERNVGAFGGGASASDWALGVASSGIGHCCTGTCTRAIYYVWENMLEHSGEDLRVNLLLNRASQWVDVYSYVPYEGRIDLKIKQTCRSVKLRAPEWLAANDPRLTCRVNGSARGLRWEGRYVNLGTLKAGDKAEVTFPMSERTVRQRIGAQDYTLLVKGNTVISIDPPGKNGPLYQGRSKYRSTEVAMNRVTRFVPAQNIRW